MRPRRLSIAGLHSFRERQEIDFQSLSETGMFGIFGPTGSGKSTILDAMTLALYGEVGRAGNHTQGILNHAETRLAVSYEFSIGLSPNRQTFRVERTYKRGEDVSVLHHASRLLEIYDGGEAVVLADTKSEVTRRIKEILGLEPDDFMRAVVLPQGKFAEFLQLSGSERNRMTERLFGLERYGQQLVDRLTRVERETKTELERLSAALDQLGDASAEAVTKAELALRETSAMIAKVEADKRQAEMRLEEGRGIRQDTLRLAEISLQLKRHAEQAGEIIRMESAVAKAKRAQPVVAANSQLDEAKKRLGMASGEVSEAEHGLCEVQSRVHQADVQLREAQSRKDSAEPKWLARLERLSEAERLESELAERTRDLKRQTKLRTDIESQLKAAEALRLSSTTRFEALQSASRTLEEEAERLAVQPEERAFAEELRAAITAWEAVTNEQNRVAAELADCTVRVEALERDWKDVQQRLTEARQQREALASTLIPTPPHSELALQTLVFKVEQFKSRADDVVRSQDTLNQAQIELAEAEQKERQGQQRCRELEEQRDAERIRVAQLRSAYRLQEQADRQRLASLLRADLRDGEPCPVCGSTAHPRLPQPSDGASDEETYDADRVLQSMEEAESRLQQFDHAFSQAASEAARLAAAREAANAWVTRAEDSLTKECAELVAEWAVLRQAGVENGIGLAPVLQEPVAGGDDFWWVEAVAGMESLIAEARQVVSQWMNHTQSIQADLGRLDIELSNAEKTLVSHLSSLATTQGEHARLVRRAGMVEDRVDEAVHTLEFLVVRVEERAVGENVHRTVSDADPGSAALAWLEALTNRHRRHSEAMRQLADIRRRLDQAVATMQRAQDEVGELEVKHESAKLTLDQKQVSVQQLTEQIARLLGGTTSARVAIDEANQRIQALVNGVREAQTVFASSQKAVQEAEIQAAKARERLERANLDAEEARTAIVHVLSEAGFEAVADAEESILSNAVLSEMAERIESYHKQGMVLESERTQIEKRLGSRRLDESEWKDLCDAVETLAVLHSGCLEQRGRLEHQFEDVTRRHEQWASNHQRYDACKRDWDRMVDLRATLRGNSFVEYLAREQLEAVASDASHRLGSLTRGRYGLEATSDGGFVMVDWHNGGVRRPVTTLSGGETFLTSLSLALSLSSHIQLRGQYPLEFFFLDEGFGTLDPELLDIVVSALEQLHMEQVVIGVISHVPELRQRLGRRLIVQPAEPAGRGTRVKVEKA